MPVGSGPVVHQRHASLAGIAPHLLGQWETRMRLGSPHPSPVKEVGGPSADACRCSWRSSIHA